jgi:hypothetical protein
MFILALNKLYFLSIVNKSIHVDKIEELILY